MDTSVRAAICQDCDWQVSGSSAWNAAEVHETDTGHTVKRTGPGARGTRPARFTQPLEGPSDA
ncbi:hypothetical protein Q6348_01895 [Isoptericola sp. b441]|uniref:C2H2-type domain-containing protein n=1 Tax=Actinotalea lenta TaxID=3064654 RepID=A0ABT9D595_9CELL|nr:MULTISPECIES: hypothetical protein [unclassified Isoptericola]MDO8105945.1 hypothetical protein [Isoptericola sp. b441]MDO8122660.1 hypothetical protein [Isoptericola sp. b490]